MAESPSKLPPDEELQQMSIEDLETLLKAVELQPSDPQVSEPPRATNRLSEETMSGTNKGLGWEGVKTISSMVAPGGFPLFEATPEGVEQAREYISEYAKEMRRDASIFIGMEGGVRAAGFAATRLADKFLPGGIGKAVTAGSKSVGLLGGAIAGDALHNAAFGDAPYNMEDANAAGLSAVLGKALMPTTGIVLRGTGKVIGKLSEAAERIPGLKDIASKAPAVSQILEVVANFIDSPDNAARAFGMPPEAWKIQTAYGDLSGKDWGHRVERLKQRKFFNDTRNFKAVFEKADKEINEDFGPKLGQMVKEFSDLQNDAPRLIKGELHYPLKENKAKRLKLKDFGIEGVATETVGKGYMASATDRAENLEEDIMEGIIRMKLSRREISDRKGYIDQLKTTLSGIASVDPTLRVKDDQLLKRFKAIGKEEEGKRLIANRKKYSNFLRDQESYADNIGWDFEDVVSIRKMYADRVPWDEAKGVITPELESKKNLAVNLLKLEDDLAMRLNPEKGRLYKDYKAKYSDLLAVKDAAASIDATLRRKADVSTRLSFGKEAVAVMAAQKATFGRPGLFNRYRAAEQLRGNLEDAGGGWGMMAGGLKSGLHAMEPGIEGIAEVVDIVVGDKVKALKGIGNVTRDIGQMLYDPKTSSDAIGKAIMTIETMKYIRPILDQDRIMEAGLADPQMQNSINEIERVETEIEPVAKAISAEVYNALEMAKSGGPEEERKAINLLASLDKQYPTLFKKLDDMSYSGIFQRDGRTIIPDPKTKNDISLDLRERKDLSRTAKAKARMQIHRNADIDMMAFTNVSKGNSTKVKLPKNDFQDSEYTSRNRVA